MTWKLVDTDNLLTSWRYLSIEGQCHYLTLAQGRVHTKIQTGFSQKLLGHSELNFVWKLSGTRKWKFVNMILVTWQKWPPCPYMVKTLKKPLSPEPVGRFSRNLVCSIWDSCPSSFIWMMTLEWPWLILRQGQIRKLRLFYRKKWKQWIFQKVLKPVTWKLVDTDN